jgi:hypothetical protein
MLLPIGGKCAGKLTNIESLRSCIEMTGID